MKVAPICLLITVRSRMELDAALDQAVNLLKPAAMAENAGIAVTRVAAGHYKVCLNDEVPRGTTIEIWGPARDEQRQD